MDAGATWCLPRISPCEESRPARAAHAPQYRGAGIVAGRIFADLNGDGVLDYGYDLAGYSCPGGPTGAGFCGVSGGCPVDVVMSGPRGHREVEGWIGVLDVAIGKAGNQEIIILTNKRTGGGTGATRHRWNGRGFVRM
jgi:hypothetical protein